MKFDCPSPALLPQLRALFKTAFGDSDDWLDRFFSLGYSPDRCRCVLEDGRVLAALYWFDAALEGRPLAYLYAVATDPCARNRGLCRALMEDTKALLSRRGYAGILLKPADEGLRQMYARMGYAPCVTVSEAIMEAGAFPVPLEKVTPAAYAALRRQLLPAGGVVQEGPLLELLAADADFYAGDGFLAALQVTGGPLHCHELLGDISAAPGILRALSCDRGFFRFPGTRQSFASFTALQPDCPVPTHFGLPLD